MTDEKLPFDIIEDEPPPEKPKRKGYRRPLFGHIPWRWVGGAFAAGMILVASLMILARTLERIAPPVSPAVSDDPILDVAESGGWTAVAKPSSLNVYRNGTLIHTLDTYPNHTPNPKMALAFSPNQNVLAALVTEMTAENQLVARLRIYNLETGNTWNDLLVEYGRIPDALSGVALAYSPDGKYLAYGAGDGRAVVMDAEAKAVLSRLDNEATGTYALAFSPDSRRLTIIFRLFGPHPTDSDNGQLESWDLTNLESPQRMIPYSLPLDPATLSWAALSADGSSAAFTNRNRRTELWNIPEHFQRFSFGAQESLMTIEDIAISPDGKMLAYVQRRGVAQSQGHHTEDEVTLHAERLHFGDGYPHDTEDISQPRIIGPSGVYLLHFEPDDSGLAYVDADSNHLMRWDFATDQTEALDF